MTKGNVQSNAVDSAGHSLADVARLLAEKKRPPVDNWNPTHCGHSDMRIASDGTWFHAGSPIGRPALVRLFSTILRREPDGGFVLVTPVEKLDIDVEDAPFIAVEATSEGAGRKRTIAFRLNTDDYVLAGREHPIRVDMSLDGTPRPYVTVRDGLDARIGRSVFYGLVEWALAEAEDDDSIGLWSAGAFFPLGAIA